MSIINQEHKNQNKSFIRTYDRIYENIFEELKANGMQPNEKELKERINQMVDFLFTKTAISQNYDNNAEQQKEDMERLKRYIRTIDQCLCEACSYQHGIEEYAKAEYEKANDAFVEKTAPKFYFAKVEENREKRQLEIEGRVNEREDVDLQDSEKEQVTEVDKLQGEKDILSDEETLREVFSELDEDTLDTLDELSEALSKFMDEEEDLDL